MLKVQPLLGTHDILMLTLDTLRYDVAVQLWEQGRTPNFASVLPENGWEKRHSPGNFTFAAHQAMFAGFFPTPAIPGKHPRLFAVAFPGSETISPDTCVFDSPDIVTGFAGLGYHTLCVGGVGFFNKRSPLGSVLPNLFAESVWEPDFGVTNPDSFASQISWIDTRVAQLPANQRLFLFLNVSAVHQPNCHYLPGATQDTLDTHAAALEHVDRQLPVLLSLLQRRAPLLCIMCSDHGTAYGEEGYSGHRLGHPVVWDVPYAEFLRPQVAT